MKNELTRKEYWEQNYRALEFGVPLLDLDDFRQLPARRIVELIRSVGLSDKRVLEVGAGNSSVLLALAGAPAPGARYWGLDYAEAGCESLRIRAQNANIDLGVINADLFAPDPALLGQFDVVYSIGVVEHFNDLGSTMQRLAAFVAPGGSVITVIPNMRGMLGWLARLFNRPVYELHVPHDLASFTAGHVQADLAVAASGYVCSSNFGMLAACFDRPKGLPWRVYQVLTRSSKLLWYFESRWGELPKSRWFSPYLYVISGSANGESRIEKPVSPAALRPSFS